MQNTKQNQAGEQVGHCDYQYVKFTKDDASELYYMIRNRGFSSTRTKLLETLKKLDPFLAWGMLDK